MIWSSLIRYKCIISLVHTFPLWNQVILWLCYLHKNHIISTTGISILIYIFVQSITIIAWFNITLCWIQHTNGFISCTRYSPTWFEEKWPCHNETGLHWFGAMGLTSQRVYELIIQISYKFLLLLWEKYQPDHVTILHMSRQLSCRAMCKFVTWQDHQNFG